MSEFWMTVLIALAVVALWDVLGLEQYLPSMG